MTLPFLTLNYNRFSGRVSIDKNLLLRCFVLPGETWWLKCLKHSFKTLIGLSEVYSLQGMKMMIQAMIL